MKAAIQITLLIAVLLPGAGCRRGEESPSAVATLNVLMNPDTTGVWKELIDEFEKKHPSIRINAVGGPTSTNGREDLYVASFLSGESVYDLVFADVVWVAKFAAAGWLEDLTDKWTDQEWGRFLPGSIEGGSYRGRIYRVPIQLDGGVLYYRVDLLRDAGENPPASLEQFVDLAQRLQIPGERWGYVWQGKQYEGLVCNFLEILAAHGGYWIDSAAGKVGLEEPAALAALNFMRDCIKRWKISPPGVTTYTEEESRQTFQAGRAVFLRNWPYVLSLSEQQGLITKDQVGIMPIPKAAGGRAASTLGGWGFAIAAGSKYKEEAWTFIQFISALTVARRMHEALGMQPALRRFYEESSDPAQKEMYQALLQAVARPALPQYAQASDILQRYISAGISGQLSPEEALHEASRETQLLLARGGMHE